MDRVLALLLGLGGLAGGLLLAAEVVAAALGRPALLVDVRVPADRLGRLEWGDGAVITAAALLLAAGLLLLAAELTPRRHTQLVMEPLDPRVTCTVSTRSLRQVLENAATRTPGVEAARATVRRRRARLRVTVPIRDRAEAGRMADRAGAAAADAAAALRLRATPRVVVRTTRETA